MLINPLLIPRSFLAYKCNQEGTAIFKATNNPPQGKATMFMNMDGKPSDLYLWLTGQASKMLKGEEPLALKMPER